MNKTLLIGIAGVVILAVVYMVGFRNIGSAPSADVAQEVSEGTQENKGSGSLKNVFGMSGSYECTISSNVANGLASGVVYVSDGNVRGDFTTQVNGVSTAVHMIQTGGTVYNWSDAFPQGVKVAVDTKGTSDVSQMSGMFDANAQIEYACEPATVPEEKFVPPATVTFMDMSALMPSVQ